MRIKPEVTEGVPERRAMILGGGEAARPKSERGGIHHIAAPQCGMSGARLVRDGRLSRRHATAVAPARRLAAPPHRALPPPDFPPAAVRARPDVGGHRGPRVRRAELVAAPVRAAARSVRG